MHDPRVQATRAGALVVEAGARESVPDARREVQQQHQQEDAPQREPQRRVRLQVSLARLCPNNNNNNNNNSALITDSFCFADEDLRL